MNAFRKIMYAEQLRNKASFMRCGVGIGENLAEKLMMKYTLHIFTVEISSPKSINQ